MWHRVWGSSSLSSWTPCHVPARIDTRFPHRLYSLCYCLFSRRCSQSPTYTVSPATPPPPRTLTEAQTDGRLTPARRPESQRAHVPAVPHAGHHARRHPLPVQDTRRLPARRRALPDPLLHPQLRTGLAGDEWDLQWERTRRYEREYNREQLRRDWRDTSRRTVWKRARQCRYGTRHACKQLFCRRKA